MADNTVKFIINVGGNAVTGIAQIDSALGNLLANTKKTTSAFDDLVNTAFKFNQVSEAIQNFSDVLSSAIQPGIDFDYSLRELSAIAGATGDELEDIGNKARNLAKTFGGSAAAYVESFKDVIGSLGETFSDSTALDMMGTNIATLSKLMGGDAKAAANALTTAMLQYGVDLKNPIEATKEATRMMNVMQAAANVGGSEVSDTAEALRQSGLLAKQSGLSFEELNASLEALAKGKVVAGEAGTAMRNMLLSMNTLSGAPKKTAAALKAYGVDVKLVSDPTAKFTDRLRELSKIQGDAVLMEDVFMKANIAAGSTILQNIDAIDEYTEAITGTNAATEGAAIIMESYAERQSRIQAQFEDLKISIFNATGDLGIWTQTIAAALVPVSLLIPLLTSIGSCFAWIKGLQVWQSIQLMNLYLAQGTLVATGFGAKMLQATIATMRFGTVGIFNALKGLGALLLSFVTAGAASATFAGVASTSFAAFALSAKVACKAVSTAIMNIPIIGWIAAAIAAIIALISYFSRLGKSSKDTSADTSNAMKDAMQAAQSYYAQERVQLDLIFEKLRQTNPKSEERKRLVKELADLYPELNKQTLDDIKNTNNLSGAYDTLIANIQRRALAQAKEKTLESLYLDDKYSSFENELSNVVRKELTINPTETVTDSKTGKAVEVKRTYEEVYNDFKNRVLDNETITYTDPEFRFEENYFRLSDEEAVHIKNIESQASNIVQGLAHLNLGGDGNSATTPTAPPHGVRNGAEATASGGTRNTQITIHLGKFFDNMVFNGGISENAKDIEQKVEEIFLRLLYSAQNAG